MTKKNKHIEIDYTFRMEHLDKQSQACVRACRKKVTEALKFENFKVVRDHTKCIGCGECVINCPTNAWTRSIKKYYKLVLLGRTGKKNPRLGQDFITWIDEESIKLLEYAH